MEDLLYVKEFHEPVFLEQKLDNMKDEEWRYKDGTPIANHVNDFLGIIKELVNLGIEFDDEVNGLILLNTLPKSWESFRLTTINSFAGGKVTLEITTNRIFEEEKRMRALGIFSQSDIQALVMKNRGRNNGGEYSSKEFKDYYSKHGIRHEKTVPGTPQHNGVAEWTNQEKATRCSREGVEDLTPAKTPSRKIANEEDVHVPEDETKEPTIEEDEASVDGGSNEQGEQHSPQEGGPQLRRSTREHKPSIRYPNSNYLLITKEGEPENFHEVQSHKDKDYWMKAMQEKMNSLHKNNTYELVELPKGRKTLKNKWVFKLKKDVAKMNSIQVVLGLAASMNLELEQLDVKIAFLHGDLHEEIYMDQPKGFEEKGKEQMVCKLNKSLYGLKQAPRQW
ncbi:hypothetical protein SLEP1_g4493 [Rubroshorea leprosula]|uniref:Integrase catalytic domain-containing protein n=1 Tax=Rubroshorea leprosula TaxID=152421 RepID=A0AAV5HZC2_9ROSI|nr:hypothetical protein SLEP1_g4493 [Rubroshorea leprosula]